MSDIPYNVHYQASNSNSFQNSQDRFYNSNYAIQNSRSFENTCNETFKGPYLSTAVPVVGVASNRLPPPICSETRTSVSSGFTTRVNLQFPRPEGTLNGPPPPFRPPLEMPCSSSVSQIPQQPPISSSSFHLQLPPQAMCNSNMSVPLPRQQNVPFPTTSCVNSQPYMCNSVTPQRLQFQQFSVPPPPITHNPIQSSNATCKVPVPQCITELQNSQMNANFVPQNSADYQLPPFSQTNAHSMSTTPRFPNANTFSTFPPPSSCAASVPLTAAMVCPNNDRILNSNCNSPSVNIVNSLQSVYCHSSGVIPSNSSSVTTNQGRLEPPPPLKNHLLPFVCNLSSDTVSSYVTPPANEVDALKNLLEKFKQKVAVTSPDEKEDSMSVAQYVYLVKNAWRHLQELSHKKTELESLVHCEPKTWVHKVKSVIKQQYVLCDILNKITDSQQMDTILSKLQKIRKKRLRMKHLKEQSALIKSAKIQQRQNLHREIDRWHEVLREKAEQQKRDAEMKKEADYILSEVRKKNQEAKRSIEKLKMLEKLRHIRKENSMKKGMLFLPSQDRSFEAKISEMKEVMQKQLSDYEAEERALKVMLETEQEGQREKEAEWRLKKLKSLQEKKHREIIISLFGESEPPDPEDPMFLFHQYYDCGNKSIDSLIQIRHTWDICLVPPDSMEGSSIPERWVIPNPPSDKIWHTALARSAK